MKTSIPRTLLTAIPALAAAGCTENPAPRPNVIFILMDDAGYGDFGCYGQQKIETPNIDALSELGVRFTDMYSAAPLSSPARCGLLTGRHAGHAQIRANDEMTQRGEGTTAEALCAMYKKLNEQYFGPEMVVDDEIALEWARIPHFYYDYYVYQYATGYAAAIALSRRILREGEPAVRNYLGFLSGGCSADPITLLRGAGVDMASPKPVEDATALFDSLIGEMEELLK